MQYCVIGFPVKHSLSPRFHNRAFQALKIPARYKAIEVKPENLANFMASFREKFAGANVTIPHKVDIITYLDRLSPEARAIGAVNCIVNREGMLLGYNTDVDGAMAALQSRMHTVRFSGKTAVVLGAGGAARAVVYGLRKAGAKVWILNRTPEKASALAREFGCQAGTLKDFGAMPCDILVNTTSVGMSRGKEKTKTPLPDFLKVIGARPKLAKKPMVMDIIYRPRMTKLLREAQKVGCKIVTGDTMFVKQAAKSFELWTARKVPLSFQKI